jgi:hypothetical protein
MKLRTFFWLTMLSINVCGALPLTILWQSNRKAISEEAWIHELLDGFEITDIDDRNYKRFINNAIVVIDADVYNHLDYFKKLQAMNYTCGFILLGDERYGTPQSFHNYIPFVFRNYWHKEYARWDNVHFFPLGYISGFKHYNPDQVKTSAQREYLWSFAGQIVQKPTRKAMIAAMKNVPNYHIHEIFAYHGPNSLPVDEYQELLLNTIFVPCPTGWINLDSFRVYEALECGCIPIVEKKPLDYFGKYFGNHPFLVIESWDQAPTLIAEVLADPVRLEERRLACHQWWLMHKDAVKKELRDTIMTKLALS